MTPLPTTSRYVYGHPVWDECECGKRAEYLVLNRHLRSEALCPECYAEQYADFEPDWMAKLV